MVASKFEVKVRGVTFHPGYPENLYEIEQWWERGPREGSLIREPDNEHDANAVAVFIGGEIIGHVPAFLARDLAPLIDAGQHYTISDFSVLIDPEHKDRPGLLIRCEQVKEHAHGTQ